MKGYNKSLSTKLKVPQDLLNFEFLGPTTIVGIRNNMLYLMHHNYSAVLTPHQYKNIVRQI